MAHRATVFGPNDIARLRKLSAGLAEFVAKLDGGTVKPPVPPAKKRKPTGAAAHKSYLAKQAAKGKALKPQVFTEEQKAALKEVGETVPA